MKQTAASCNWHSAAKRLSSSLLERL